MLEVHAYQYWVFDLDGTLTKPIFDFKRIKEQLGLPTDQGILEVLPKLESARAAQITKQLDHMEGELAERAQLAPGAFQLLTKLAEQGASLGILTRNKKSHTLKTLEVTKLKPFFRDEDIFGRKEASHKPSPDGLLQILKNWQAPAHQALMVGDYLFDLQAGRNAGMKTLYVDPSGTFPFCEYADFSIKTFKEIHL